MLLSTGRPSLRRGISFDRTGIPSSRDGPARTREEPKGQVAGRRRASLLSILISSGIPSVELVVAQVALLFDSAVVVDVRVCGWRTRSWGGGSGA